MRYKVITSIHGVKHVDFRLREYLAPGGKYPYSELADDMEQALREVGKVYLWSVHGFLMVSGHIHNDSRLDMQPWHNVDTDTWHKSVKDALYWAR